MDEEDPQFVRVELDEENPEPAVAKKGKTIVRIPWKLFGSDVVEPSKKSDSDAGIELYLRMRGVHHFEAGKCVTLDTGVGFDLAKGGVKVAKVEMRSRFSQDFIVSGGVIDREYTGPISVTLHCVRSREIPGGMALAQLVPIGDADEYLLEDRECTDEEWSRVEKKSGRKRKGGIGEVEREDVVCRPMDPDMCKVVIAKCKYEDQKVALFDYYCEKDLDAFEEVCSLFTDNERQIERYGMLFDGVPIKKLFSEMAHNVKRLKRCWVFVHTDNSFEWVAAGEGQVLPVVLLRMLIGRDKWSQDLASIQSATVLVNPMDDPGEEMDVDRREGAEVTEADESVPLKRDNLHVWINCGVRPSAAVVGKSKKAKREQPKPGNRIYGLEKKKMETDPPERPVETTLVNVALNAMERMWHYRHRTDWDPPVVRELFEMVLADHDDQRSVLREYLEFNELVWPKESVYGVACCDWNESRIFAVEVDDEFASSGFGTLVFARRLFDRRVVKDSDGLRTVLLFVGEEGRWSSADMVSMYIDERELIDEGPDVKLAVVADRLNGRVPEKWFAANPKTTEDKSDGLRVEFLIPALYDLIATSELDLEGVGLSAAYYEDLLQSCGRNLVARVMHRPKEGLTLVVEAHSLHRHPHNSQKAKALYRICNRWLEGHSHLKEKKRIRSIRDVEEAHTTLVLKKSCACNSHKDDKTGLPVLDCELVRYVFNFDARRIGMRHYLERVGVIRRDGGLSLKHWDEFCSCNDLPDRKKNWEFEPVFLYCSTTDVKLNGGRLTRVTTPGNFDMVVVLNGDHGKRYWTVDGMDGSARVMANWFCLSCKRPYRDEDRACLGKVAVRMNDCYGVVDALGMPAKDEDLAHKVTTMLEWTKPREVEQPVSSLVSHLSRPHFATDTYDKRMMKERRDVAQPVHHLANLWGNVKNRRDYWVAFQKRKDEELAKFKEISVHKPVRDSVWVAYTPAEYKQYGVKLVIGGRLDGGTGRPIRIEFAKRGNFTIGGPLIRIDSHGVDVSVMYDGVEGNVQRFSVAPGMFERGKDFELALILENKQLVLRSKGKVIAEYAVEGLGRHKPDELVDNMNVVLISADAQFTVSMFILYNLNIYEIDFSATLPPPHLRPFQF